MAILIGSINIQCMSNKDNNHEGNDYSIIIKNIKNQLYKSGTSSLFNKENIALTNTISNLTLINLSFNITVLFWNAHSVFDVVILANTLRYTAIQTLTQYFQNKKLSINIRCVNVLGYIVASMPLFCILPYFTHLEIREPIKNRIYRYGNQHIGVNIFITIVCIKPNMAFKMVAR